MRSLCWKSAAPLEGSRRRKLAMLQVARSLADLKSEEMLTMETLKEAMDLCLTPFRQLTLGMSWD